MLILKNLWSSDMQQVNLEKIVISFASKVDDETKGRIKRITGIMKEGGYKLLLRFAIVL